MIGVGVVAFVIVVLIVMAIIVYNTQKELSILKKEDTFLVKAVKKISKQSTKFVSDKLELDNKPTSEADKPRDKSRVSTTEPDKPDKPNE